MIKLLKNMRRKEKLMALLCLLFVVVQVYFDLRPPDYMSELTVLIKISGTTADIVNVGLKMLGCTAISAVLAIACGFLAAKTSAGFSFAVRDKLFHHVMDIGSEEMQDFSIPSLITRTTNDINDLERRFRQRKPKVSRFSETMQTDAHRPGCQFPVAAFVSPCAHKRDCGRSSTSRSHKSSVLLLRSSQRSCILSEGVTIHGQILLFPVRS